MPFRGPKKGRYARYVGLWKKREVVTQAKKGGWLMLKNVHLAPEWLVGLEKQLHGLTPHAEFRLFLTMEFTPKVPGNLVRW